jgi:hypothetical protein
MLRELPANARRAKPAVTGVPKYLDSKGTAAPAFDTQKAEIIGVAARP